MKKSVAIMSCNIGGLDEIYPPAKQTHAFDFYYYTENNLPFPLPEMNNRLKGKYFKTQAHKFLDHDIFIWMDGSVEIYSETFVQMAIDNLQDEETLIRKHTQRENVYEELLYIINKMKEGDRYLLKRYARQPFVQEFKYYKENGLPKSYPLFNCSCFARINNKRVNTIFDEWWDMILRFSNFDQSQFSYVAWRNKLKIKMMDMEGLIARHKHQ